MRLHASPVIAAPNHDINGSTWFRRLVSRALDAEEFGEAAFPRSRGSPSHSQAGLSYPNWSRKIMQLETQSDKLKYDNP